MRTCPISSVSSCRYVFWIDLSDPEIRSDGDVTKLEAARGGSWPLVRWIHRRRPILTAVVVLLAPVLTLVTEAVPVDLLSPSASLRFVIPWFLMIFGFGVRLWGSGNLRKNQEITNTGIYRLVRHPLYLGSLSFFLAYFLTVGDPWVGLGLFALLVAGVYYPTMLGEEEYLTFKFPTQFSRYQAPPRLIPDPRRFADAISTDRFEFGAAYRNLGFRSGWFLIALPVFLRLLDTFG
jgi:protein-S-isoprenylcysteine O-methyltransferase Ste14